MTFHPDPKKCDCYEDAWRRPIIGSLAYGHHPDCELARKPRDPGCKLPSSEIGTNLGDMLKKALEQPEAQGGR